MNNQKPSITLSKKRPNTGTYDLNSSDLQFNNVIIRNKSTGVMYRTKSKKTKDGKVSVVIYNPNKNAVTFDGTEITFINGVETIVKRGKGNGHADRIVRSQKIQNVMEVLDEDTLQVNNQKTSFLNYISNEYWKKANLTLKIKGLSNNY